ncbi:MAG: alanine racemase [Clostridia bacterium]|nr:alanine racemase [Clostridia bacterium]MBR4443689.1 alanine racemase [Clostridia bacterium]
MLTYEEATARCWAEVDLDRVRKNYQSALRHLKPGVKLIAVLKANAYGLGAANIARFLRGEGQTFFAAASFNEAEEILAAVPDADVLILGLAGGGQIERAVADGLILTVFSERYARDVISAARRAGKKARAHVKVETGLHRLGLMPEEAPDVVRLLHESGAVSVEGVFTHLALRDKENDRRQLDRICSVRDELNRLGLPVGLLHALDSIGMVRYPDDQMDAVRTGAWLYGVCPRGYDRPDESQLALTVKARVAQLHFVPAGECLGYDETHPLARDSVVATLSAGYIDGFPRLNSVGSVLVRGQRAPVAGLVCMDQMMVDVTDIPGVREGDEAILLGGGIGVNEYADLANLNRNEALARTGRRVPRVYLDGGRVVEIACDIG